MCRSMLTLLLVVSALHAADDAKLRDGAQRALDLLIESNKTFYKTQTCFSCHHQGLTLMAAKVAREHGLRVDETSVDFIAKKALTGDATIKLTDIDEAVEGRWLIDPSLGTGSNLVAAGDAGVAPSLTSNWLALMLSRWQLGDGSWFTPDMRPPLTASPVTATAIAVRAVSLYFPRELEPEKQERLVRARMWLRDATPKTTEDATYKLLGLWWAGAEGADLAPAAKLLKARRNEDGGWGQLDGFPSDAYSTGQSVAALLLTGAAERGAKEIEAGLEWLIQNQRPDGSWLAETRLTGPVRLSPPMFDSGFPHGRNQFLSAAATNWGVMAFAAALPKQPVPPRTLTGVGPEGEQPWMRTAMFGDAEELKALLANGLSSNTATGAGTTLLMMAAHDADKVIVLLLAGADAKATAKSGVSALIPASYMPGSAESIRLLLKKGAGVKPKQRVRNNANPLLFASMSGDEGAVALLLEEGAEINKPSLLLGIAPATPIQAAVFGGHAGVIRMLAWAGVNLNEGDSEGLTPLAWAAVGNRTESARALLELRVNPSKADSHGYTPLHHASTVAYGDANTAELLVLRGMDPKKSVKDAPTPLELARKSGSAALVRTLEETKRP